MRLFRISNLLSLMLATFFGVLLFWTSQSVQSKEDELADLRGNLNHEEETIRVLSVEWDYLNRPQRLEKLAIEQLGMELPDGKEVVKTVNDIPEPVIVPDEATLFEEGFAQSVSLELPAPQPAPVAAKKETVSPAAAEKQSFDKLIQSLDTSGGDGQ
jgi:cell division protein FtsL